MRRFHSIDIIWRTEQQSELWVAILMICEKLISKHSTMQCKIDDEYCEDISEHTQSIFDWVSQKKHTRNFLHLWTKSNISVQLFNEHWESRVEMLCVNELQLAHQSNSIVLHIMWIDCDEFNWHFKQSTHIHTAWNLCLWISQVRLDYTNIQSDIYDVQQHISRWIWRLKQLKHIQSMWR